MSMKNENKQMKWMMWAMMLCCLGPILFALLFGAGARSLGAPSWIVIAIIAIVAIAHFFLMNRSHKQPANEQDVTERNGTNSSGHSGCH